MLLSVFSGWYSYNYDFVDSPLYAEWTKDYEDNIKWRHENRVLHPLKPMHDPEPVIVYAPAPSPIYDKYAMADSVPPPVPAPAPVEKEIEVRVVYVEPKVDKKWYDHSLINSLVIPIILLFGSRVIDRYFPKEAK